MNEVPGRETAAIPGPPRTPRLRACALHYWGLMLAAGILLSMAVVTQVVFLVLAIPTLPFDDLALDEQAARTEGVVEQAAATSFSVDGVYATRVQYRFRLEDGIERQGTSYLWRGVVQEGAACTIEYLPDAPSVHRMAGTKRVPAGWLPVILLHVPAVLGFLLAAFWLRGVLLLRLLLRTGPVVTAQVIESKLLARNTIPPLRLRYRFRTTRGEGGEGGHHVHGHSPLGRRLLSGATTVQVIYDEGDPKRSRAVDSSDFEPS